MSAADAVGAAGTLPELLHRAAVTGDGVVPPGFTVIATGAPDQPLPYAELERRAGRAAAALRAHGVGPGDRVGLLGPTSVELLVAMWGTWAAGAVVVVLPSSGAGPVGADHAAEVGRRLAQVGAALLLAAPSHLAALDPVVGGVRVVGLGSLDAGADGSDGPHATVCPDDVAVLQFTSGTTARSRAVTLTHRQLLANVAAIRAGLGVTAADRGLSWLPLFHDMGLIMSVVAVAGPGDLVLLPTEEFVRRPGAWMDAADRFRSTVTVAPSTGYSLAAKDLRWRQRGLDLSALRIAGNGAEPVDPKVLTAFAAAAGAHGMAPTAPCPMYGLAEVTLAVTLVRPGSTVRELVVDRGVLESERVVREVARGKGSRRLVSAGVPVPGTRVEIRDADGTLPPGRVGEIVVDSPSRMAGYWRDPAATAEVLTADGLLRTGDLGLIHDGELYVCGRMKDMIIAGGRNLYPEDYEQLAAGRDGVRSGNVIAFGLPDTERMVVVAESRLAGDAARTLAEALLQDMTRELSHAPEEVIVVRTGTLPKTSSGKVQRDVCRQRYRARSLPVSASAARR